VFTCAACGTAYAPEAWDDLVLSCRIDPMKIGRLVLHWPEDSWIEVRACSRCSHPIAVKRRRLGLGYLDEGQAWVKTGAR
jgi:hypothetical protein